MLRKSLVAVIFFVAFASQALRIGVIGAGPSGLVAAAELKARGYDDVTILEAAANVGGKVKSVHYQGHAYEMGAVITSPDYDIVFGIARELNIPLEPIVESLDISPDGEISSFASAALDKYGRVQTLLSANRFRNFVNKYAQFFEPGFAHTPPELLTTYEEFMRNEDVEAISEAFRTAMVGCGYGFSEDMPAAYWMKLMRTFAYERVKHELNPTNFFQGNAFFHTFPEGWQDLWKRFVENRELNVRLGTKVLKVMRRQGKGTLIIDVETTKGNFQFDRLIVSVPHLAYQFMDLDANESALFSQAKTIPYKVTLLEIEGLPTHQHLFPRAYSTKYDQDGNANDGNVVLLSSNQRTPVYQAYQFTTESKTSKELHAILMRNIARMGARVKKVISEELFDYFPHFDVQAFIEGIPFKLEGLQGKRGTYYTGALMNFETVELSAKHAQQLIRDHFVGL